MIRFGKKFSKPTMSRVINGDILPVEDQASAPKIRLDLFLTKKYPEYKRATLQKFIKMGAVTLNGTPLQKSNLLVSETDNIILTIPNFDNTTTRPPVIYEDDYVLVVDKPAGLLSMQKGELKTEPTLEDFGFLVHRLDRDTSGVVILAKDIETRAYLQKQFQQRTTKKHYLAITSGTLKHKQARIELPIARNLKKPNTFDVDPNGREAITEYQVLAEKNDLSLVELTLLTGRTHQIRVHMKHLGAPILGDPVYGKKPASRLFLHAKSLELTIPSPTGGIRKTFYPNIPSEFLELFPEAANFSQKSNPTPVDTMPAPSTSATNSSTKSQTPPQNVF